MPGSFAPGRREGRFAFRRGSGGAEMRGRFNIARLCHEKGTEKLWRKNTDCATGRRKRSSGSVENAPGLLTPHVSSGLSRNNHTR